MDVSLAPPEDAQQDEKVKSELLVRGLAFMEFTLQEAQGSSDTGQASESESVQDEQ